MTVRIYPLDLSGGSPSYVARAWRQTANAWIGGRKSSRPLGARSGIFPGQGTPVSAASGSWTVTPCAGTADVQALAIAGPYVWSVDANVTGSITAADASNPRVDIVYVQINDNSEDSTGSENGTVSYLAGTAASSPSPPATPARSLVLAQINVPAGATNSATVTMVAPYVTAAGGILPVRSLADLPATPYVGQYADHPSLGMMRSSDGSTFAAPLAYIWKYGRAAAQAIASGSSFVTVVPDTTLADTASTGLASNGYVSPCAQWVRPQAFATFVGAATGVRAVQWVVNGTPSSGSTFQIPGTADGPTSIQTGAPAVLLAAADVVTMQVKQTSGSTINITGAMLEIAKA